MSKKLPTGIYVREKPRTYTARQFLPRTQGEDEWPVGVRFATPKDGFDNHERYVVGNPAHSVIHHGDWVLTDRGGSAIVVTEQDFKQEFEEDDDEGRIQISEHVSGHKRDRATGGAGGA